MVHEGEKNHKCPACNKAFSTPQHLTVHINSVHEGVKQYTCGTCGKAFSQFGNLRTHIKTVHEGMKEHQCRLCSKAYTTAQSLIKHINNMIINNLYCLTLAYAIADTYKVFTYIQSIYT